MRFWFCLAVALWVNLAGAEEPQLKVIFCGDIMLADLPGKAIERGVDPFAEFAPLFREADLVIGNLECVVATKGEPFDKPWTFRAHPRVIPLLQKHFHALSIANNHTGDFGREAFVEMLDLMRDKMPLFGGGRNKVEAHKPVILEKKGFKLALLGYNRFQPRDFEAGENHAGCAWVEEAEILADMAAVQKEHQPHLLVPFMHWGREGDREPQEYQRDLAKKMCAAGASLVVGAHPHVTQTIEYFDKKPALYSLGNFVFDGFDPDTPERVGWLWRVTFDRAGVLEWDTITLRIDEEGLPKLDQKTSSPRGNARTGEISAKQ